jgi:hypothetical protein
MSLNNRRISLWLAVAGVLLLVPGTYRYFTSPGLKQDDLSVAFSPLVRIPLHSVEHAGSASVVIKIPDNQQWTNIRRAWGTPAYILAAVSPEKHHLYCFDRQGFDAQVSRAGEVIALEVADHPIYGYSTDCKTNGLQFRAGPGTELLVRIAESSKRPLPSGEFIVTAYWGSEMKDNIVGVELDRLLAKLVGTLALIGSSLIVVSATARLFFGRRNHRSA